MLKKLVLIGGGGHCKSVLDAALAMNEFDEIVITDATPDESIMGCQVIGIDEALPKLREDGFNFAFVTVGSIKSTNLRKKLVALADDLGYQFPIICDPSACVSPFAAVDTGTFIGKNAVLNAGVKVGKHCIINTGAILEHGCTVDSYTHISVGAILCGDCRIEHESFIGAGSTVVQGITIGNSAIVGAGSVIIHDVPQNCTAVGNPGRVVEK